MSKQANFYMAYLKYKKEKQIKIASTALALII